VEDGDDAHSNQGSHDPGDLQRQLERVVDHPLAQGRGARAVGLGGVTGSIEVGLAADLVVLDTRSAAWAPRGDLALQLVYGGASGSVRDVVVDGTVVVRDRRPTRVDVDALRRTAAERSAALLRRAGIDVPHRWPSVGAS